MLFCEKKTKSKNICNDEWWRSRKRYEIWNTYPQHLCRVREACRIYSKEMNSENKKLTKLKNLLLDGIRSKCDEIYLNGSEIKEFQEI